jgi:hypothetical protein
MDEHCRGYDYTTDVLDPKEVKAMKKELEEMIQSLKLHHSYFGNLHIRRGDSINDRVTSISSKRSRSPHYSTHD